MSPNVLQQNNQVNQALLDQMAAVSPIGDIEQNKNRGSSTLRFETLKPTSSKDDDFNIGMKQFQDLLKDQDHLKTHSDGNILGGTNFKSSRFTVSQNENLDKPVGKRLSNRSAKSFGSSNGSDKKGANLFMDALSSQGSNTDSELSGDLSQDEGDYQDLPIIVESNQEQQQSEEQGVFAAALDSRNIKTKNNKTDFKSYDERLIQHANGEDIPKSKKSRVFSKKIFDRESSKA